MRQYEKNIGKVMPIFNFGEIKYCRLIQIKEIHGMCYLLELLSDDKEILERRWLSRNMYRIHVLQKV